MNAFFVATKIECLFYVNRMGGKFSRHSSPDDQNTKAKSQLIIYSPSIFANNQDFIRYVKRRSHDHRGSKKQYQTSMNSNNIISNIGWQLPSQRVTPITMIKIKRSYNNCMNVESDFQSLNAKQNLSLIKTC